MGKIYFLKFWVIFHPHNTISSLVDVFKKYITMLKYIMFPLYVSSRSVFALALSFAEIFWLMAVWKSFWQFNVQHSISEVLFYVNMWEKIKPCFLNMAFILRRVLQHVYCKHALLKYCLSYNKRYSRDLVVVFLVYHVLQHFNWNNMLVFELSERWIAQYGLIKYVTCTQPVL